MEDHKYKLKYLTVPITIDPTQDYAKLWLEEVRKNDEISLKSYEEFMTKDLYGR